LQLKTSFPNLSVLKGILFIHPWWYYGYHLGGLIDMALVPVFFYGFYAILRRKCQAPLLLLQWFLIILIIISLVPEKDTRYALPLIPAMLLIAGLGLECLINTALNNPSRILAAKIIALVLCLCLAWKAYPQVRSEFQETNRNFAGLPKAGRWIKARTSASHIILTTSYRPIRYYTGINFFEFGGSIISLPRDKDEFKNLVSYIRRPIIIEIDRCEFFKPPAWRTPVTQETITYLNQFGFRLVKIINENLSEGKSAPEKIEPVVWIFERP
jgi:hypothetical protein